MIFKEDRTRRTHEEAIQCIKDNPDTTRKSELYSDSGRRLFSFLVNTFHKYQKYETEVYIPSVTHAPNIDAGLDTLLELTGGKNYVSRTSVNELGGTFGTGDNFKLTFDVDPKSGLYAATLNIGDSIKDRKLQSFF